MRNNENKKSRKIWLWIGLCLLIVVIVFVGAIINRVNTFNKYMDTLVIDDVSLDQIKDGMYIGIADAGVIKVTVSVTISNNLMQEIEILSHRNGQGEMAQSITQDVLDAQTLLVDDVSGATYSSKVIKKAIENALFDER